jgi:hypothetical protein
MRDPRKEMLMTWLYRVAIERESKGAEKLLVELYRNERGRR